MSDCFMVKYCVPGVAITAFEDCEVLPFLREMVHQHYDGVIKELRKWHRHRGLPTAQFTGMINRMVKEPCAATRVKQICAGDTVQVDAVYFDIAFEDKSEAALFKLFHC